MLQTRFYNYLRLEKRYSRHTLTAYQTDLEQLWEFLTVQYGIQEWPEVKNEFIRSWVASLAESEVRPRSINRKISAATSFFKYCVKQKLLPSNPALGISKPRVAKSLPVYLEEAQTEQLIDPRQFADDAVGLRDRLILELFYTTGIRLNELLQIQLCDINYDQQELKIHGKRNKERIIPLSGGVIELVEAYLTQTEKTESGRPLNYLFEIKPGRPLYPKLVYLLVNKYIAGVSVARKKSPHVLRHTFATQMLNRGADINAIKELLGHSSLAATQVYTHNSIAQLKNIHRISHPKG